MIDNIGGDGREKCEYYPERIVYSVDNGKMARGLAKCIVDADYLINSALLKTHSGPGVTLTTKNWYGATYEFSELQMRELTDEELALYSL